MKRLPFLMLVWRPFLVFPNIINVSQNNEFLFRVAEAECKITSQMLKPIMFKKGVL